MKKSLNSLFLSLCLLLASSIQAQVPKQVYDNFAQSSLYHFDLNGQNTQHLASYLNGQYRKKGDSEALTRRVSIIHLSSSLLLKSFKITLQYRWQQENRFLTTQRSPKATDLNQSIDSTQSTNANPTSAYETKQLGQSKKHMIALSLAKNILFIDHHLFYQISLDPSLNMQGNQLQLNLGFSHWLQWQNLWFSLFVHSYTPWRMCENGLMFGLSVGRGLIGLGWGWLDGQSGQIGQNQQNQQNPIYMEIFNLNFRQKYQGLISSVSIPMNAAFHLHASLYLDVHDPASGTIMLAGIRWTGEKESRESDEVLKNQIKNNPLDPSLPSQPSNPNGPQPTNPNRQMPAPNTPKIPDFKRDSQKPLSPI